MAQQERDPALTGSTSSSASGRCRRGRRAARHGPARPRRRSSGSPAAEPDTLRQYYFDPRGVHRIYEMTLADGVWTLSRDDPNPFPQRFEGRIADDGQTIEGSWEKKPDGSDWEIDFDLTYRKLS